MDESYVHAGHIVARGIARRKSDGSLDTDIPRAVGKGERTCFIGAITRSGFMAARQSDGKVVRDCAFIKNGVATLKKGGKFVELNNEGNNRDLYKRPPKVVSLSCMKKPALLAKAETLNVSTVHEATKKTLTVPELIVLIRAARAAAVDTAPPAPAPAPGSAFKGFGKDFNASLDVMTDWDLYWDELKDMSPTSFKFMIANQVKGDYHDDFDTKSFFKWMVAAAHITYPIFILDNAPPYHHGIELQLRSKSKAEIVKFLQDKNISTISYFVYFSL
jgi:hypothetical protein